jgi:hypothetical protein
MSNPRYSDPHRSDQSRSFGVQEFWPWLTAALTALGLLLGGFFGYYWGVEHQKSA